MSRPVDLASTAVAPARGDTKKRRTELDRLITLASEIGAYGELKISSSLLAGNPITESAQFGLDAIAPITNSYLTFRPNKSIPRQHPEPEEAADKLLSTINDEIVGWGNRVLWATGNYWSPYTGRRVTYVNLGDKLKDALNVEEDELIRRARKLWHLYFYASGKMGKGHSASFNQFVYELAKNKSSFALQFPTNEEYDRIGERDVLERRLKAVGDDYFYVDKAFLLSEDLRTQIENIFKDISQEGFRTSRNSIAGALARVIEAGDNQYSGQFAEFLKRFQPRKVLADTYVHAVINAMLLYHHFFATYFFTSFPIQLNGNAAILSLSTLYPLAPSERLVIQSIGEKLFSRLILRDVSLNEDKYIEFVKSNLPKPLAPLTGKIHASEMEDLLERMLTKKLPIVFVDIADFTRFFNRISANDQDLKYFIEGFNEFTSVVIDMCNGWVNKFLGDGALAIFFEARNFLKLNTNEAGQTINAVLASTLLIRKFPAFVRKFNDTYKKRHDLQPPLPRIRLRIGLHLGTGYIRNWGPRLRHDYTVMGDSVNLSSRLAGSGPHLEARQKLLEKKKSRLQGGELLASSDACKKLTKAREFRSSKSVRVRVRGQTRTAVRFVETTDTFAVTYREKERKVDKWIEEWHLSLVTRK